MGLAVMKKQATNRLKRNLAKAVSLTFVVFIALFLILLSQQVIVLLLDTIFIHDAFEIGLSRNMLAANLIGVGLSFLLLSPLQLSIKGWYMKMSETNPPLSEALGVFTSWKRYWCCVFYSFIKSILFISVYFVLITPALIIATVLKSQLDMPDKTLGLLFLVLFAVMVVFIILAVCYAVYVALGFFYADYLFLSKKTKNPLKAVITSVHLSKYNRGNLLSLYLSFIPYLLACVLIVPIIFVAPYIKSNLAFFAQEKLKCLSEDESK